ncbi:hypothetical protein [Bradyrhizobium sp. USDA 4454]
MRDIDGRLGDRRVHVHDGLVAHERAGEQLDAVLAHREPVARPFCCLLWRRDLGQLHLARDIDGMAALREDVAGEQNGRTGNLARGDALAQGQRVVWIGAEIPDRGETPPRQHLLHVLRQHRGRRCAGVVPDTLREMHMAVPEPRNNGLAAAIDQARIRWHRDLARLADRADHAV